MLKSALFGLLLVLVVWYGKEIIKWGGFFRVIHSQQPGPCHAVEGVYETADGGQGSEDVEVLPSGLAIFSSGLNYMRNPALKHVPGRIMLFDFNRPESAARSLIIKGFKDKLNPHGISIWNSSDSIYVYVIHHGMDDTLGAEESVEKFRLDVSKLELTHLRTIKDPLFTSLNDLVMVGEDQFYVSNDYVYRNNWIRRLEYFSFLPFNNIIYFDGEDGYQASTKLRRPNGISVSPDRRHVYVAESGAGRITSFMILPDKTLEKLNSLYLDTLVDNVNVDQVTGDLWIGSHPIGYKIFLKVMFPVGSVSPSLVLRVPVRGGDFLESTQIYADDGHQLIASGSAVRYNDAILIGTPTHKLMYCKCLIC